MQLSLADQKAGCAWMTAYPEAIRPFDPARTSFKSNWRTADVHNPAIHVKGTELLGPVTKSEILDGAFSVNRRIVRSTIYSTSSARGPIRHHRQRRLVGSGFASRRRLYRKRWPSALGYSRHSVEVIRPAGASVFLFVELPVALEQFSISRSPFAAPGWIDALRGWIAFENDTKCLTGRPQEYHRFFLCLTYAEIVLDADELLLVHTRQPLLVLCLKLLGKGDGSRVNPLLIHGADGQIRLIRDHLGRLTCKSAGRDHLALRDGHATLTFRWYQSEFPHSFRIVGALVTPVRRYYPEGVLRALHCFCSSWMDARTVHFLAYCCLFLKCVIDAVFRCNVDKRVANDLPFLLII